MPTYTRNFKSLEKKLDNIIKRDDLDAFFHGIQHSIIPLLPDSSHEQAEIVITEEYSNNIEGYIYFKIATQETSLNVNWEYIYVSDKHRSKGIGKALARKMCEYINASVLETHKEITIETTPTTPAGEDMLEYILQNINHTYITLSTKSDP